MFFIQKIVVDFDSGIVNASLNRKSQEEEVAALRVSSNFFHLNQHIT